MKLNNWKKFWWKIDLIGIVFGLALIVFYILRSDITTNDEVKNIWANFATEIVGVWLSVRIIGEMLDKKAKFRHSRFKIIDNFDFFYRTARRVLEYQSNISIELYHLKKEVKYFDLRWDYRKQFLFESEISLVDKLRKLQLEIIEVTQQIESSQNIKNTTELTRIILTTTAKQPDGKERLRLVLSDYERFLELLREDVWDETHPDQD